MSRTWSTIIYGRPISKKNSKRIFRMGKRTMLMPSTAYTGFHHMAMFQLMDKKPDVFDVPTVVTCTFNLKGKMRIDLDNAFTSILDILQDAGVLADDTLVVGAVLSKKQGYKEFATEITVAEL